MVALWFNINNTIINWSILIKLLIFKAYSIHNSSTFFVFVALLNRGNRLSKAFLLWWIQVVTVSFAAILIFTYGWFDELWNADQTKISFIIITIFVATSIATGFLSFRSDTQYIKLSNYIWFASETMVTLGLIGTVAGFLLMLSSAFDNLDVSNVENVQKVISNMALGMSTALCTTLSGLIGSVLTKIQMVILENNTKYE